MAGDDALAVRHGEVGGKAIGIAGVGWFDRLAAGDGGSGAASRRGRGRSGASCS